MQQKSLPPPSGPAEGGGSQIPVYVLAGGQSRRFGRDKARALFQGQALILKLAQSLEPFAQPLQVVASQTGQYADLNLSTIADQEPYLGPMGGLYTALLDCIQIQQQDWLLLASCDTLNVTPYEIQKLLNARSEQAEAVAYYHERWQPIWALYHRRILPSLEQALQVGERSLSRLLAVTAQNDTVQKLEGSALNWIQINRPIDLKRAEGRLKGQNF